MMMRYLILLTILLTACQPKDEATLEAGRCSFISDNVQHLMRQEMTKEEKLQRLIHHCGNLSDEEFKYIAEEALNKELSRAVSEGAKANIISMTVHKDGHPFPAYIKGLATVRLGELQTAKITFTVKLTPEKGWYVRMNDITG